MNKNSVSIIGAGTTIIESVYEKSVMYPPPPKL
jgi:hypothetical protein